MEQLTPKTTDKKMCYSVSGVGAAEIFSKMINARRMLHTSVGNTCFQSPTQKHRNKAEITQQGNFFFTKRVLGHDPNQARWQAGSGGPRGFYSNMVVTVSFPHWLGSNPQSFTAGVIESEQRKSGKAEGRWADLVAQQGLCVSKFHQVRRLEDR